MTAQAARRLLSSPFAWLALAVLLCALDLYAVPGLLNLGRRSALSQVSNVQEATGRSLHDIERYELTLRRYLTLFVCQLLWAVGAAYLSSSRLSVRFRALCAILGGAALGLLSVLLFDARAPLYLEESRIALCTSVGLWAAGCICAVNGFTQRRRQYRAMWLVMAAAFIVAGADELLTGHEALGAWLETSLQLGHWVTDSLTLLYPSGAFAFALVFRKALLREHRGPDRHAFGVLMWACALLMVAMLLDTFDVVAEGILERWAAGIWTAHHALVGESWQVAYLPHQFLNSIEEVLEFLSAALLLGMSVVALLETDGGSRLQRLRQRAATIPSSGGRLGALLWGALAVGSAGLFVVGASGRGTGEVLLDGAQGSIAVALGPNQGLVHVDDLAWDARLGLLVANEWGKSVIQLHPGGEVSTIADASDGLTGPDSVTVHEGLVYVADESGTIFKFDEEGAGGPYVSLEVDGVGAVGEGVVFGPSGHMYVVSEHHRAVFRLEGDEFVRVAQLEGEDTVPEDLCFDRQGNLLITDDRGGSLFRLAPDGTLSLFADRRSGLRNPEGIALGPEGTILVADNGARAIHQFDERGNRLRSILVKEVFGDLQGIAWDGSDTVYVASSNSYGGASFVPSFVFRMMIGDWG